jgi:hypothetical protein
MLFTFTDDAMKSSQMISHVSIQLQSSFSESVSATVIMATGKTLLHSVAVKLHIILDPQIVLQLFLLQMQLLWETVF